MREGCDRDESGRGSTPFGLLAGVAPVSFGGTAATLAAAERVFHADSVAALVQLRARLPVVSP